MTLNTQPIDDLLSQRFKPDEPGAAVIVCQDSVPILRKGYGLANLELQVPVEPRMVFRIGSVTKQFTAVAILMLLEEGKLDLQDPLDRYLPDYPAQGKTITIEHLLTHTSGIRSYTDMPEWLPLMRKDLKVDEMIAIFKDQPLDFGPGERWQYNNSGYFLLGAIIEKVSGKPYARFIQERIFEPLAMKSAFYDDPGRLVPGRAAGYSKGEQGTMNAPYISMSQPYSAGSLACSVDDLALWDAALYTDKLLKPEILQKAWTSHILPDGTDTRYGYGWGVSEYAGFTLIAHGGGINGFVCQVTRIPGLRLFTALLTNSDGNADIEKIAFRVTALAMGKPYEQPVVISLPETALQEFVGVYQIDPKNERIITVKEGRLHSQRTGGSLLELQPVSTSEFYFTDSDDSLVFQRGIGGKITGIQVKRRFGPLEVDARTDKPLPAERQALEVDSSALERYAGKYELAPDILFTIAIREGKVYAQMTGQPEIEIFPEKPGWFFARVVDAQIEFTEESGAVSGLVIHQGGQEIPAKKINQILEAH
jgi:CubicO group peptidase (beta-lactamase class C family)